MCVCVRVLFVFARPSLAQLFSSLALCASACGCGCGCACVCLFVCGRVCVSLGRSVDRLAALNYCRN